MGSDPIDICLGIGDQFSVKPDFSAGRFLKQIQTAQKGALSGTGGANNNYLFPFVYVLIHSPQYLGILNFLVQVFNYYHFCAASSPACPAK